MTQRGAFIVFEGLDRCGKTTQVEQLAEGMRREGRVVKCMKFPGEFRRGRVTVRPCRLQERYEIRTGTAA
jgi:thymidylate kinase